MESYLSTIEQAVYLFPFVAVLLAVPYFYYQYRRNGAIRLGKSLIGFAFLLYLVCCYALVVLPFPAIDQVAQMQGPYTDLRVLGFVRDFFNYSGFRTNPASWPAAMASSWFYIPLFNFLLLMPFGVFERSAFNDGLAKCVCCAFFLSLSFELIQLSGFFWVYPRPYRLFQLDDLLLNTLGAAFGWFVAPRGEGGFEPRVERLPETAPGLGQRAVAFMLDLFALSLVMRVVSFFLGRPTTVDVFSRDYALYLFSAAIYYLVVARVLGYRTPAGKLLEQDFRAADSGRPGLRAYVIRQAIVYALIAPAPFFALAVLGSGLPIVLTIPAAFALGLVPVITLAQLLAGQAPFYETLTGVYLTDGQKTQKASRQDQSQPVSSRQSAQGLPSTRRAQH